MAPGLSLFGPMDIDSYSLYANMRVYGMIILAIVSTIAFFGEKHVGLVVPFTHYTLI